MKILLSIYFFGLVSCSSVQTIRTQHGQSSRINQTQQNVPAKKNTLLENQKKQLEKASEEFSKKPSLPIEQQSVLTNTTQETVQSGVPAPTSKISVNAMPTEMTPKKISTQTFETDFKKVGVILPLTGKNSVLGQRALAAIRLGIDSTRSELSLVLFDSQGLPELAAQGVEKLLKEERVIALMGGLGGKEATAISERADFFQVPFFTFSQKSDLTKNSDHTFRNSITAGMQTSQLVEYATQKLGLKKFAILYPNDAYGVEFANQFWDHVLAFGGSITAVQFYNPKEVDLTVPIQKLVGTYYIESRMDEYKAKAEMLSQKKQASKNTKKTRESSYNENKLDPVIDFDALFIPDSGKVMGQAIGFLKAADVTKMIYLGTNLWNTDDISRRANQTGLKNNNEFYFVDHLITDEQRKKSEFNSSFLASFNEAPSIIETQTYESAKIIKDLILAGNKDRKSLTVALGSLGRKQGAYSEIFMNNTHEIIRDLTIFHLENGLITPQNLN